MERLELNYKPTESSTELTLYIRTTGRIYKRYTTPIILNLAKKYTKGIFETEKALKAFYNLANEGAKAYAKEFADAEWKITFSVADKKLCAMELLDTYYENINGENPLNLTL